MQASTYSNPPHAPHSPCLQAPSPRNRDDDLFLSRYCPWQYALLCSRLAAGAAKRYAFRPISLRSIRALVALLPLAIRAFIALSRPLGSIRALVALFRRAQYALSFFLPVCTSTASASPRVRRERTLVRPLALGLASLYLHQTDKKSVLSHYFTAQPRPTQAFATRSMAII